MEGVGGEGARAERTGLPYGPGSLGEPKCSEMDRDAFFRRYYEYALRNVRHSHFDYYNFQCILHPQQFCDFLDGKDEAVWKAGFHRNYFPSAKENRIL